MRVFEKILCPIDFSETSAKALQWAESLVNNFDSELIVLQLKASLSLMHVVDSQDPMFGLNFYANPIVVSSFETSQKQQELVELGIIMIKEPPDEALIRFAMPIKKY